jgi:hypothetical protein
VKTPTRRTKRLLATAVVSAGGLVTAGALALPASAGTPSARPQGLTVRQIASGTKLHHKFQPGGKGAWRSETLSKPDDITEVGRYLYVSFQNGVGAQGEPSASGNLDSTIAEFTLSGRYVRQWDLRGKSDGLTADPETRQVIATVNEDAKSSLYTISERTGQVTHYAYNKPLPHKGGTDAISIFHGQILISASAPGTTGAAAPQASYPAVYVVRLNSRTRVATVDPLFYGEATATAVNGPHAGKQVKLGLTDPDSSEIVPGQSPQFAGDFMLNSQGDLQLIFDHATGAHQNLSVLNLSASVDDSAWATRPIGALYATDNGGNTLDVITGAFKSGTAYTAATPCNANSAPATCPAPGFPANYLATINLKTGALTKVSLSGPALQPQGLIFVPAF